LNPHTTNMNQYALKQQATTYTLRDTTNSHARPTSTHDQHAHRHSQDKADAEPPKFIHPPLFPVAKTKRDSIFSYALI